MLQMWGERAKAKINQKTKLIPQVEKKKKSNPYNATRSKRRNSEQQFQPSHKHIRHVEQQSDDESSESDSDSADEDIGRIVQHLKVHRTSRTGSEKNQCKIWINGAEVTIEPDTGADANAMDEYQFSKLKKETTETSLKRTKIRLKTLTDDLPVIGECQVLMENETRKTQATIAIVRGRIDSQPLLGRKTLERFGHDKI